MNSKPSLESLISLLDDEDETVAVNVMAELLNRESELGELLAELQEGDNPLARRRAHQLQAAITLRRRRRAFAAKLEAQKVDLIDGLVYVDGVPLDEPYTQGKPSEPLKTAVDVDISYPYTIPDGHIWVMGDNRTSSADSRYFGPIPVSSVSGRAAMIYWPLDHIGVL